MQRKDAGTIFKELLVAAKDAMLVPLLAVLTAIVIGGVVIALVGGDPFAAYAGLFEGSFGSVKALSETAVWASPYIFAGLAVALAFKGGLFNIGAEGQLALGARTGPAGADHQPVSRGAGAGILLSPAAIPGVQPQRAWQPGVAGCRQYVTQWKSDRQPLCRQ